jgi:TonB family protein
MRRLILIAALPVAIAAHAQERIRTIAQIPTTPGVIEVLARTSDGVHIGLWDGVFTYNCGSASFDAVRNWVATAHALADTNVAVAKDEIVVLKAEYFPGCSFDLTREAAGRTGRFHFNSITDYGAGSINIRTDRRGFLHFLSALDTAAAAAYQMGVADKTKETEERLANQTYFEYQVEKPVMTVPGSPSPRYPDILKSAGVEGEVVVTFVVDTTGRADVSSLKIIRATHELFAAAVRTALPAMRFLPAEVGGKKVRQLVQEPFTFPPVKP